MMALGFNNFAEVLKIYLAKYRLVGLPKVRANDYILNFAGSTGK